MPLDFLREVQYLRPLGFFPRKGAEIPPRGAEEGSRMLKIECPTCKNWLHSPFLMEMEEMKCPNCATVIQTKDVYIAAGPYMINRDVLLKHVFKYKRLFSEAAKEYDEIKKEGKGQKAYKVSSDTIKVFMDHLKELLEGCRNGFRVAPEKKEVDYSYRDEDFEGKLVNISMSGICVGGNPGAVPYKGDSVTVSLKEGKYDFKVTGEVVWADTSGMMGLRFQNMDDETRKHLVNYIIEKGAEAEKEK